MQTIQEKVAGLRQKKSVTIVALHHGSGLVFDTLATVVKESISSVGKVVLLNKNKLIPDDFDAIETADIFFLESSHDFSHPDIPKTSEAFDYLTLRYVRKGNPDGIIIVISEKRMDRIAEADMQLPYNAPDSMERLQEAFPRL